MRILRDQTPKDGAASSPRAPRAARAGGAVVARRPALDPASLLSLQRTIGNRATTQWVQRIEESHAWLQAMKEGNRGRVMTANNQSTEAWLTKIGDFAVEKGFTPHDSKGNNMAFMKDGTMAEAKIDAAAFGMNLTAPKKAKNMYSKKDSELYGDTALKMTLRPFSASSKNSVAVIDFMVDPCRFEFKYLNEEAARAAGHYGEVIVPVIDAVDPDKV